MVALRDLQRTGAFERVPIQLRKRLLKISDDVPKIDIAASVVRELVLREMSSRIMQVRSEEADQIWRRNVELALREQSKSKKGISDSFAFTFNHEARSRGVDIRDPKQPIVAIPGGPTFVLRDWLTYPASLTTIEAMWSLVDYLYFNEKNDGWYYQLTRDDLKRANTGLADFLKPVRQVLAQNTDYQYLTNAQPILLSDLANVKSELADRVRNPKQISDLIGEFL